MRISSKTYAIRQPRLISVALAAAIALLAGCQAMHPNESTQGMPAPPENATVSAASAQQKTLYERLGGYGAISAVVEDFAPKLFNDVKVGRFFVGMSADTRKQFMQKNKNLVCNVTGGPCQIISRPAKVAHGGLGISEGDFGVVVAHLVDTLNKFQVPPAEQKELLAIIGTLKPDIVEKTSSSSAR